MKIDEYTNNLDAAVRKNGGEGFAPGSGAVVVAQGIAIHWKPPEGTAVDHSEVGPAARAVMLVSDLIGTAKRINADDRLSDAAKQADIATAAVQVAVEMKLVANGIEKLQGYQETAEAEFYGSPRPADAVAQLAQMEIRQWFLGLDSDAQMQALRGATHDVLAALVGSPIPLPESVQVITTNAWRAAREAQDPEKAQTISAARERREWARTVLEQAQAALPKVTA